MFLRILLLAALAPLLHAEPPKALVEDGAVQLVASEPDVRTPTAIAVDPRGRVWVLENNTHFRPKNYDAPPTDRVLVLDDFGKDGRAQKITTFADGFSDGMGLLLLPGGDVIVSTRAATVRMHDADGDGYAEDRRTLLTLVTDDKYPHNGLSGIARGPDGALYLGLGENHGFVWTLIGRDGAVVRGSDEGGIFRFDGEGSGLVHWAWGVWNPFGLAFDPAGRLFALDNDPGGGSFCRLLHIVEHGDYGYRYRYNRAALAWRRVPRLLVDRSCRATFPARSTRRFVYDETRRACEWRLQFSSERHRRGAGRITLHQRLGRRRV
jgi:putative membrane-bound dehydrogenase-like protein